MQHHTSQRFLLDVERQVAIARQFLPDLEHLGNGHCVATCPGECHHSTHSGKRDFAIWFSYGKGPHDHCFHKSCASARDAIMRDIWSAISKEDPSRRAALDAYKKERTLYHNAPTERPAPIEPYHPTLAMQVADANPVRDIDDDWLLAHSPIRIPDTPAKWPAMLLDALYTPQDNILIFTKFASQGQLLYTPGSGAVRLEERPPRAGYLPGKRTPSGFPKGAQAGVWFLAAPITGEWQPNDNNRDKHGAKLGRRHAACCTKFPYLVLESDDAPPAVWLAILTQLAEPIVAIYTSGGKSYHALIRVNARTKEEFDAHRRAYVTRLAALGADPAAITAVRLTRLPGCLRYGVGEGNDHRPYLTADGQPAPRMQRLLYLHPQADHTPIIERVTQ